MKFQTHIFASTGWKEYELLDSGDGEKLERFGAYTLIRPDPKAIWNKTLSQDVWNKAQAVYERSDTGGGRWIYRQKIPESWTIKWKDLSFILKPTGFKHLGIFPEQSALWEWTIKKIKQSTREINLLNLFAYTGGSTLAAASAGAKVTHLDSAKEILTWARENAIASGLDEKPIRWIPEDAVTFVKREIKRGNKYDAIIMDPPKFGRGNKNEVWKIEEDLPHLMKLLPELLSNAPLFIILNAYTVSYSSVTLGNLLSQTMKKYKGSIINGELTTLSSTGVFLPNSIFSIWENS